MYGKELDRFISGVRGFTHNISACFKYTGQITNALYAALTIGMAPAGELALTTFVLLTYSKAKVLHATPFL